MAAPQTFPTVQEFAQYAAQQWGLTEVIYQPLYHYRVYPTAGVTNLAFFGTAIGGGTSSAAPGNANNALDLVDTDMQGAGQLPAPQAFFCTGIEVVVDPGSSATANTFAVQAPSGYNTVPAATVQAGEADVNAIYSTGALTFQISSKPYFQMAPLGALPPSFSLALDSAVALTANAAASEAIRAKLRAVGRLRKIEPGIGIGTSQNFNCTLTWPVVVPTPSGFNARVGVVLDGWLFRAAQ